MVAIAPLLSSAARMHRDHKAKEHRRRGQDRYGARSNFSEFQLTRNGERRTAKRKSGLAVKQEIRESLGEGSY